MSARTMNALCCGCVASRALSSHQGMCVRAGDDSAQNRWYRVPEDQIAIDTSLSLCPIPPSLPASGEYLSLSLFLNSPVPPCAPETSPPSAPGTSHETLRPGHSEGSPGEARPLPPILQSGTAQPSSAPEGRRTLAGVRRTLAVKAHNMVECEEWARRKNYHGTSHSWRERQRIARSGGSMRINAICRRRT